MQPPPSRYKVVEQGRRLVVIDTWNGDRPATRQAPRPDPQARAATRQQARMELRPGQAAPRSQPMHSRPPSGGVDVPDTVITTQRWYDNKGPRRLKLDTSAQGLLLVLAMVGAMAALLIFFMWGWPVFAIIGFFLIQKKVRAGLRAGATAWLDGMQPG